MCTYIFIFLTDRGGKSSPKEKQEIPGCVCMYLCMYKYVLLFIYVCIFVYICMYINVYIHMCIYVYIYVYLYISYGSGGGKVVRRKNMIFQVFVCTSMCVYGYIYMYIYIYIWTYVYMCPKEKHDISGVFT
jgi:hypothetical protein